MSKSNLEHRKNISSGNSLSTILEFVKNLEDQANVMQTHGYVKEAAATKKWALELRTYLIDQNYSLDF
jgi:hypothetical protein